MVGVSTRRKSSGSWPKKALSRLESCGWLDPPSPVVAILSFTYIMYVTDLLGGGATGWGPREAPPLNRADVVLVRVVRSV